MTRAEIEKLIQMVTQQVVDILKTDQTGDQQLPEPIRSLENPAASPPNRYVLPCGHDARKPGNKEMQSNRAISKSDASPQPGTNDVLPGFGKHLITEHDIIDMARKSFHQIVVSKKTIITPSAFDRIKEYGITIFYQDQSAQEKTRKQAMATHFSKKVALLVPGLDHTTIKTMTASVSEAGYEPDLLGTQTQAYRIKLTLAELTDRLAKGVYQFGIVLHENVFPLCIQANRLPNIYGVVGWDIQSVKMSRQLAKTNLLFLNHRQFGLKMLKDLVKAWLLPPQG